MNSQESHGLEYVSVPNSGIATERTGTVGKCFFWHLALQGPGFPAGSDGKESAFNAGVPGLVPGSGRSPGEANGNPLQYSCLENSMDRGAWLATVHGLAESGTTKHLTTAGTGSRAA